MKKIILLITLLLCSVAQAKWVLKNQVIDIDTKDKGEIERSFSWAKNGFNTLNRINLVSEVKIIVNEAKVRVNTYDWEDDENCTAVDLNLYKDIQITKFYYGFYYQDDTGFPGMISGGMQMLVKCQEGRSNNSKIFKTKTIFRK